MSTTDDLREERLQQVRMIRDSAAGIAPRSGDFASVRVQRFKEPGFDRAVWSDMCAMGWTGLRISEDNGGAGLGMQEFCAVAEELGAALRPEPLIPCALAAQLVQGETLAHLLGGARIVAPALQDETNTLGAGRNATFRNGRVDGRKVAVPFAAGADAFVVSTANGPALVVRDASGVTVRAQPTQDGGQIGVVTFENAPGEQASGDIEAALDEATLATAAYLLGVMDGAFAMTLAYLKTRRQFGKAIGSFQALQHRAVDLRLQVALTRASVEQAAVILDGAPDAAVRGAAVSRAKARAADASMRVTRQAVQMHGAIGYTDECDIGLFLRKAMTLANAYGSSRLHRRRFAELAPQHDDI